MLLLDRNVIYYTAIQLTYNWDDELVQINPWLTYFGSKKKLKNKTKLWKWLSDRVLLRMKKKNLYFYPKNCLTMLVWHSKSTIWFFIIIIIINKN
jgi:hypothetical protein